MNPGKETAEITKTESSPTSMVSRDQGNRMQSHTDLSLHPSSSTSHGIWVKSLTFQSLGFCFCKVRIIMPTSKG